MDKKFSANGLNMGLAVRNLLEERDLTVAWLARQIDFDSSNLCKQLKNKHIYPELLLKISAALKTDFFSFYSERYNQIIQSM
ncbi:MAG: hypothetical protein LBR97_03555 [Dysgonamonadaceae bacterium]|jgi:hypothetical protein|nr:hypothetical protein [Dysgonamonadaceae bacterium]